MPVPKSKCPSPYKIKKAVLQSVPLQESDGVQADPGAQLSPESVKSATVVLRVPLVAPVETTSIDWEYRVLAPMPSTIKVAVKRNLHFMTHVFKVRESSELSS